MKGIVDFSTMMVSKLVKRRFLLPNKYEEYPVDYVHITLLKDETEFPQATGIKIIYDDGFIVDNWVTRYKFSNLKDVKKYIENADLDWQCLYAIDADGKVIKNMYEADLTKFKKIDWNEIEKYLTYEY